jgi:hypothetical protein
LSRWKNPHYEGSDLRQVCMPLIKPRLRGFIRVSAKGRP